MRSLSATVQLPELCKLPRNAVPATKAKTPQMITTAKINIASVALNKLQYYQLHNNKKIMGKGLYIMLVGDLVVCK